MVLLYFHIYLTLRENVAVAVGAEDHKIQTAVGIDLFRSGIINIINTINILILLILILLTVLIY